MLSELIANYETLESVLVYLAVASVILVITRAAISYQAEDAVAWPQPVEIDEKPSFETYQIVRTRGELNYSHGSGIMVPGGAELELLACHITNHGFRWSAYHVDPDTKQRIYVYPIPEDMIEPLTVHS